MTTEERITTAKKRIRRMLSVTVEGLTGEAPPDMIEFTGPEGSPPTLYCTMHCSRGVSRVVGHQGTTIQALNRIVMSMSMGTCRLPMRLALVDGKSRA